MEEVETMLFQIAPALDFIPLVSFGHSRYCIYKIIEKGKTLSSTIQVNEREQSKYDAIRSGSSQPAKAEQGRNAPSDADARKGTRYQTRINAVVRAYVESQKHA